MAGVAHGDQQAFEILVLRHQSQVINIIYRLTGSRTDADDLAQEVLLRVWRAAPTYQPTARFTTWLFRITANLCQNALKSGWRKRIFVFSSFLRADEENQEAFVDIGREAHTPESLSLKAERDRLILTALQSLPAKQRLAMVLKTYEDLSYQEIAEILECSVPAVNALLVRAKRKLAKKLSSFKK